MIALGFPTADRTKPDFTLYKEFSEEQPDLATIGFEENHVTDTRESFLSDLFLFQKNRAFSTERHCCGIKSVVYPVKQNRERLLAVVFTRNGRSSGFFLNESLATHLTKYL